MNPRFIKQLIAQGEGPTVEFKREVDLSTREGQAEFCKDLMSLANIMKTVGKTSYLLIGVDDNGEIVGMKSLLNHRQLKDAADLYCQPPVVFRYWQGLVDGKLVGLVIIPQSYRKPHKFKREFASDKKRIAENTVFTRHLSHVVVASPEEIVALDQEAAAERRRRVLVLFGVLLLLLVSLIPLTIWTGIAYARPIQEFTTMIFPQGLPLLPSGIDPKSAPLHTKQVERMLVSLGNQPFEAVYSSRIVFDNDEYVSEITMEYNDHNNWKATVKANYGLVAWQGGGELIFARKDGTYYELDGFQKIYLPTEIPYYRSIFETIGNLRAPYGSLDIPLAMSIETERQYKPWRKLVRISGRLAKVYERQAKVDAYHMSDRFEGILSEKVYIDVDRNTLVKYEGSTNLSGTKDGKPSKIYYEIGFMVTSYGNPINIDWSFLQNSGQP